MSEARDGAVHGADPTIEATARTTLRRKRERGSFDRATIYSILDEGLICHVGFEDEGSVVVLPTIYARTGDDIYLHGAAANRMLHQAAGVPVCVTVTLVDGIVFARSAFHHSMNYRSVVIFGTGAKVEDEAEKEAALNAIVDHIAPGRSADARGPTAVELKSTSVVRVRLAEASAKVRTGPPLDDEEDMGLAIWAGVLPFETTALAAIPDPALRQPVPLPQYVSEYAKRRLGQRDRL